MLAELNKVKAPSILLEDFVYFLNKTIYQYINKKYNIDDINQLNVDDIRVLKSEDTLFPIKTLEDKRGVLSDSNKITSRRSLFSQSYDFNLPADYLHLLNCSCIYKVLKDYKCYNAGDYWKVNATRLTAELAPVVDNNFYNKPSYKKPYFYIHNVNTSTEKQWSDSVIVDSENPTNPIVEDENSTTSIKIKGLDVGDKSLPRTIKVGGQDDSVVQRTAGHRYGNSNNVRMEIRCGKDDSVFKLDSVLIDYIKTPLYIRLTQEQLDLVEDTSQVLEFPDYVCQEIINELTMILMENAGDQRLQTHTVVSLSIANPAQALAQTK